MADQSMLWGKAVSFWDLCGLRLMFVGAAFGGVAVMVSLASSYILYRVADKTQSESDRKVAEANASGEEAKLEAAKANERAAKAELELKRLDASKVTTPGHL
jgi:hypothetical protein